MITERERGKERKKEKTLFWLLNILSISFIILFSISNKTWDINRNIHFFRVAWNILKYCYNKGKWKPQTQIVLIKLVQGCDKNKREKSNYTK